ncbi:MAG: D-alanine--D-alanine ligase [Proteobacteria bacterium]|nr:D-alanine--D-alanine ligase [Pseudomonadota bacterium]MBU1641433.1 D-alanine--D-alanine ligase [Pseudomonadota bacterium]
MAEKIRLALIAGGKSGEREVSLAGSRGVLAALDTNKYQVSQYDPATDLARLVGDADKLDVAFILLHGPLGEDGSMQGTLDLLGIPYQGAGVLGSALAMDKNLAKMMYREAGLKVANWQMASSEDIDNPGPLAAKLNLPVVVKPVRQGSSLGMSIAHNEEELAAGLALAFKYDNEVMVEEFIKGREITCGVLGNKELIPLPLVEIIPGAEYPFFDYQAKYQPGASKEVCPAEFDAETTRKAQEYGMMAHRALHLKGYSRTDMMVAENGDIYVIETNTIPGMTPTSLLPQAAKAFGLDFGQLLDRLIELAME